MRNEAAVRAEMTAVERDLAAVPGREALERLRSSWGRLVVALDLGPAPEVRICPHCGATGMRAATRCGTCWAALVPPDGDADAP